MEVYKKLIKELMDLLEVKLKFFFKTEMYDNLNQKIQRKLDNKKKPLTSIKIKDFKKQIEKNLDCKEKVIKNDIKETNEKIKVLSQKIKPLYTSLFSKYKNDKYYLTLNNYDRKYCVYVNKNYVDIYRTDFKHIMNSNAYAEDIKCLPWFYINKIESIQQSKVFIETKQDSKYYDYDYDFEPGNSILIQLKNGNYIFIGNSIYEFKLNNCKITDFKSPVGNNAVPYPFAIDNNKTYYLLMDDEIIHIKEKIKPDVNKNIRIDPYRFYYDKLAKDYEKIKIIKTIYKPTYVRF